MKLHHARYSSSSRRVALTVAHLGLRLEENHVDLRDPEHRAALSALNPNSKIPVLEDGDFVLWESHAIMQYLCGKTLGQTLYPTDPRAKVDVDRWLFWSASHFGPPIGSINFERMWKKVVTGADPDPKIVARDEGLFRQNAAVLDRHLEGRTWISGEALSLADFSIAATLMYLRPTKLPIDPYKNVLAHLSRVSGLDAWHQTEPPPMAW
jgi:glutathione S-transferase